MIGVIVYLVWNVVSHAVVNHVILLMVYIVSSVLDFLFFVQDQNAIHMHKTKIVTL
eukprot:TRINITY_DN47_c0_g1_i2.p2 TRINITY_DN47_c0_g1~~TRINITY_DN47_c0_g1_i2.p2  ORF type:complete len:56 (-),score=4.47 TRINITY_DN47_c0_g1_i2:465-632(-)